MRQPLRVRMIRVLAAAGLTTALILPSTIPVAAADPVVLRVGTTQDLDSLNPFATLLVVGYEAFALTYNYMIDSGPNLEPVPGYADSWERAADGKSWSFHIRDGMLWSDGTPATSADACFSWQLGLDAITNEVSLGAGYLEPSMADAGVTAIDCPDPSTVVVTTDDASDRTLQIAIPIIPKHIWGDETYKTIGDAKFDAPLVGTGPYQAVEWQTGQFIRLQRNANYWGTQGFQDEVDLIIYKTADTMVQALKAGELDYAAGPNDEQLNALEGDPNIATVAGSANGWTQLAFNGYGANDGKTIKDGGPSTKALLDPVFRDALGYAVDREALVDRVLGGYGDVGNTIVPPVLTQWHVEPTTPRTFDIELAKQKLDAAGYVLDADAKRLDKEGKPINLRLFMPNSNDDYPIAAQFVEAWYGELGIKVTTLSLSSAALGELILPPEAGEGDGVTIDLETGEVTSGGGYRADYDIELWGWAGGIDPNGLLQVFKCDAIGSSSDSQYCNPAYDQLYDDQLAAGTPEERKSILAEMQNIIYDDAVYDILYYDANLVAYRTDRFAGWANQPEANGTPLFTYSTLQYTKLTDANAAPSPTPAASAGASAEPSTAVTPAPSGSGGGEGSDAGSTTPLLAGLLAVVAVVAVIFGMRRRGSRAAAEEDDEGSGAASSPLP